MDTTTLDYPFPEPDDAVTDFPAVAEALAEKLDDERTIEGTTIAAIAAAVGGAAKGKRAMLRNSAGDRMALVYDSALGKWVGPEFTVPLLTGADLYSGSGVASGVGSEPLAAARSPLFPAKAWMDAGLTLQARLRGIVGITLTGSTTSRTFTPEIYSCEDGGTTPFAAGALGTGVAVVAGSASPAMLDTGWGGITPYGPQKWFYAGFNLTGIGTGTYSFAAKFVTESFRWVA